MYHFILPALFVGQPVVNENREISQEQLKQSVLTTLRFDPDSFEPAKFLTDNTTIYYRLGGLKDLINRIPSKPLDVPLATQATVETIKTFRWGPNTTKIWSKPLADVEEIVARELDLIAAGKRSQRELLKALSALQGETDQLFASALRKVGELEHKRIAPLPMREISPARQFVQPFTVLPFDPCVAPQAVPRLTATEDTPQPKPKFKVTVTSEPKDAALYYLSKLQYDYVRSEGRLEQDDAWCEIVSPTVLLRGPIHFRAKWKKDNKTKITSKVIIDQDDSVTLRQN